MNGCRQKSMLLFRAFSGFVIHVIITCTRRQCNVAPHFSSMEWFPVHTRVALADVKRLQSDDANLKVVVAAGAAGTVEDAIVLVPMARATRKFFFFCNYFETDKEWRQKLSTTTLCPG